MRRISSISQSIDCLITSARRTSQPSALCRACQPRIPSAQKYSFSTSAITRAQSPQEKNQVTVKEPNSETPRALPNLFARYEKGGKEMEADGEAVGPFRYPKELAERYDEAVTWEGLQDLDTLISQHNVEKATEKPLRNFLPKPQELGKHHIEGAVRLAITEVMLLKDAELPLTLTTQSSKYMPHPKDVLKLEIQKSLDTNEFVIPSSGYKRNTTKKLRMHRKTIDNRPRPIIKELLNPKDAPVSQWEKVPLEDEGMRFAVVKRAMQLTGRKLSDPEIQSCTTPRNILDKLLTPPKPTKLAEVIEPGLKGLSNVKFSKKRVGMITKEREVGRWKVIKEELQARGIPY